jgi:uncharacterized protein
MKQLYITAVVTFSGKTALALGIGLKLQAAGHKIGYFKPVSTQPFYLDGKLVDEDVAFVRRILGLDEAARDLSPVIIDDALFRKLIEGKEDRDFAREIKEAYQKIAKDKDVLLVEGGASMREGYAIGLNTTMIAEMLDLPTLGVVRYRDGLMLIDDILAMQYRMQKHLLGVVINSVPADVLGQINGDVSRYLERRGIKVYGVLPHQQQLMAISIDELIHALNARVLTGAERREELVENLSVGAMSVESALPRFRRVLNKAVITGGDRADIQAAALDTSTVALILTGNLQPTSAIIKRAEELGVAVLLVPTSTIETVEAVERVFGKTRLNVPDKLNRYKEMLDTHLDWARLFADLGIEG